MTIGDRIRQEAAELPPELQDGFIRYCHTFILGDGGHYDPLFDRAMRTVEPLRQAVERVREDFNSAFAEFSRKMSGT